MHSGRSKGINFWIRREADRQLTALQSGPDILVFGPFWYNDGLSVPLLLLLPHHRVAQNLLRHRRRSPSHHEMAMMKVDVDRVFENIRYVDHGCRRAIRGRLHLHSRLGLCPLHTRYTPRR